MREKTFVANFKVLRLFTKVFSKKLGAWYPLVTSASNPRKFSLLNSRKFLCESFLLHGIKQNVTNTQRSFPCTRLSLPAQLQYLRSRAWEPGNEASHKQHSLTISNEGIDLSDSDYVCKHVTEPLWVNKVEVTQQWVIVVKECAIVMEKSHGLF